jgi:hypothetical protein
VSKEGYRNSWEASVGVDRYRRGLYTFIQRTSPFAQFVTFDMPDASRSCTRRERSNTPLQALQLLNDPMFLEAAQALAGRIHREAPANDTALNDPRLNDTARLAYAYELVLARPIRQEESERLLAYLAQQCVLLVREPDAASELAANLPPGADPAWAGLASVLLNLDEFITRE